MNLNVFHPTRSNFIQQNLYGMTHDTIFQPTCCLRLFSSNLSDRVSWVNKPKSKIWNEQKQVQPKSQDLSRSLEIKVIWTFDTEFPTYIFIYIYNLHMINLVGLINDSLDDIGRGQVVPYILKYSTIQLCHNRFKHMNMLFMYL